MIPDTITDPSLVALAQQMMDDERATCKSCQEGWLPRHFRSTIHGGMIHQTPCGSNSRVFDPSARSFVGYSHCTCDTCF